VGGLSLSSSALRRLQRRHSGLVQLDLFHDHGGGLQFYSDVADTALGKSLAGGNFPWQSQPLYSIHFLAAYEKRWHNQVYYRRVRDRTRHHDSDRRDYCLAATARAASKNTLNRAAAILTNRWGDARRSRECRESPCTSAGRRRCRSVNRSYRVAGRQ